MARIRASLRRAAVLDKDEPCPVSQQCGKAARVQLVSLVQLAHHQLRLSRVCQARRMTGVRNRLIG